jgi:hypothetical protein
MVGELTGGHRRLIAIVAVAIVWLAPASAGAAEKLQVLVNDTAAQIQLAYRRHPDEQAARREQLAAVLAAWRAAPRNEANNERLANWLRAAIHSSMPGSNEPLPPTPSFAAVVKVEPRSQPQLAPQPTEPRAPQVREGETRSAETQPVEAAKVESPPAPVESQPTAATAEKQSPTETVAEPKSEHDDPFRDDPFRDDPETDTE